MCKGKGLVELDSRAMQTLAFLLFALLGAAAPQAVKFYVTRQWKYINFTWPDEDALRTATATGLYVPENIVVSGVKYFEDHFYITLPRIKAGVPATLARIRAGPVRDTSPDLEPFPSWQMNGLGDCNQLQNVQNVEIDTRGQMWIIDGGRVQTWTDPVVKCSPKLLIYDIKAERVATVYHFPEDVADKNGSYLFDLVVDNTDGGYAYITDNSGRDPGLIVYSVKENRSWKIRDNKTMRADPTATQFSVNDIPINAPINIAGIALGPKIHTSNDRVVVNEDREVYFCPLSSRHLYSINTTVLRNENFTKNFSNYDGTIKDIGQKASQTVGMIMDNQGILYYGLLGNNAIGRWDSHTPFEASQRLIARDNKYLEWPNSFTFDRNGNLTVLTNRLDKFIFDTKIDLNDYNFRLISSYVGGNSYLYDENIYHSESSTDIWHETTPSAESSPNPRPEPQPKPEPTPETHDHNGTSNQNSTISSNEVTITEASGSALIVSLLPLVLGPLVAWA